MKFKTFTNEDIGIGGVVPEGWVEKSPGEFRRDMSDTDQTVLIQQAVPGVTVEQLKTLLTPQLGLKELPESVGSIKTANLTWDLYSVEREERDVGTVIVDIALTETDHRTYLVVLQAMPDEYDGLHYNVFVRAVDAFALAVSNEKKMRAPEPMQMIRKASADVLLVKDKKLENQACDVVADILRAGLGLSTAFVELEALDEVDFRDVKLIFFPGGECGSIHLSEKASRKVQATVASGTGYIGICCGAFLAAEATTMAFHWCLGGTSFGIFPGLAETPGGEGVWSFYVDICHPVVSNASVASEIFPVMQMRFVGGTSNLAPSYDDGLQNWCVATLDKPAKGRLVGKRAVMTATVFGKGRVFLSGPHPEAQENTHAIILAAAEWCTRQSDPPSDQHPFIEADIPTEGIANQIFVCSATGSRDPQGFPIGFIWDFGDGSPKQHRPEAIHLYRKPGRYTITLSVTTGTRHCTKSTEVRIREP